MKSIEELDLSDNFITLIPEQIRHMPAIKRVGIIFKIIKIIILRNFQFYFARNPFTYASNYRQEVINNLPFVFAQEAREVGFII